MKYRKLLSLVMITLSLTACTVPKVTKDPDTDTGQPAGSQVNASETQEAAQTTARSLLPVSVAVGENVLWTFIDENGQYLSDPQWEWADSFSENGLAIVEKDGLRGLVNRSGELVVPCRYSSIAQFAEGLAVATKPDQSAEVLNGDGQVVFARQGLSWHYSEGLLSFQNEQGLYGYVDSKGEVTIPAQFVTAGDFEDGTALVTREDGTYALVDEKGEVQNTFTYTYMWSLGEGRFAHGLTREDGSTVYGINDAMDAILLEADFDQIDAYDHGKAIVTKWQDDGSATGVVDLMGNFVIPMEKGVIGGVGNGCFAKVESSILGSYLALSYQKSALMSPEGEVLTDPLYYNITAFDQELFSVTDGTDTFLIDAKGNPAIPSIRVAGVGVLKKLDGLIQADVDNHQAYYDMTGKTVWSENPVHVYPTVTVTEVSKRVNRFVLVAYPVLSQMASTEAQQKINDRLYEKMAAPLMGQDIDEEMPVEEDVRFQSDVAGDILHVEALYYSYGLGAAHGNYYTDNDYYDMTTGEAYTLKDLFKKDADFSQRLADEIKSRIPESEYFDYVDPAYIEAVAADHPFRMHPEGLEIYYTIYEIAPYAAGEPGFVIPWQAIEDLTDEDSSLLKAYKNH